MAVDAELPDVSETRRAACAFIVVLVLLVAAALN
ncbi:hypothetical protein J2S57_005224 [Kineosporia succinea]|uniref:Uncharacterized protein n=1 Tax=Kineosporia succinea TaxID=84632 RepID=A0ABT9PBT5_9ACTN|nr:hypothetical protein [Kineosporia succinea]